MNPSSYDYDCMLLSTGLEMQANTIERMIQHMPGRAALWRHYSQLLEDNLRVHNTLQALAGLMEREAA